MTSAYVVTVNNTTPTELGVGLGHLTIVAPATIYIGGSGVNTTDGFAVGGGVVFPIPLGLVTLEKIYGICSGADVDVHVLKTSAV